MQIGFLPQPLYQQPYRPVLTAPAVAVAGELQSTPLPPGLGLKEMDRAEGSLAYCGPPVLRQKAVE